MGFVYVETKGHISTDTIQVEYMVRFKGRFIDFVSRMGEEGDFGSRMGALETHHIYYSYMDINSLYPSREYVA